MIRLRSSEAATCRHTEEHTGRGEEQDQGRRGGTYLTCSSMQEARAVGAERTKDRRTGHEASE